MCEKPDAAWENLQCLQIFLKALQNFLNAV